MQRKSTSIQFEKFNANTRHILPLSMPSLPLQLEQGRAALAAPVGRWPLTRHSYWRAFCESVAFWHIVAREAQKIYNLAPVAFVAKQLRHQLKSCAELDFLLLQKAPHLQCC